MILTIFLGACHLYIFITQVSVQFVPIFLLGCFLIGEFWEFYIFSYTSVSVFNLSSKQTTTNLSALKPMYYLSVLQVRNLKCLTVWLRWSCSSLKAWNECPLSSTSRGCLPSLPWGPAPSSQPALPVTAPWPWPTVKCPCNHPRLTWTASSQGQLMSNLDPVCNLTPFCLVT